MKKGFTLIELLAVIVILAIIALIATPIILGIINDAREESNERSVELYASAVRNGIVAYQLRTGNEVLPGTYNETNKLPFEPDYEGNVECVSVIIGEDGKVSLDKCTVNGGEKTYNYGIEEDETPEEETPDTGSTQVYKPRYYLFKIDYYGLVGTAAPVESERLTVPPTGETRYLGYDVTDGKVSAAYSCFVRNETEYCLKGYDTEAFATNTDIIKDAYSDVLDTACSFSNTRSFCSTDGLDATAHAGGDIYVYYGDVTCDVWTDGDFVCSES